MKTPLSETPQEYKDLVYGTIDRLVLYEVFIPDHIDKHGKMVYCFDPMFVSFLTNWAIMIEADPRRQAIVDNLSELEFIEYILLPDYFIVQQIIKEKYAAMPNWQKKADEYILFTIREVAERSDKDLDKGMTEEQLTALA